MKKIAVLGNCQIYGFRHALKELLPDSTIDVFALADAKVRQSAAGVAAQLPAYDVVFTQMIDEEHWGPLRTSELGHIGSLILFPSVSFTGFQPDQVHLRGPDGRLATNAYGQSHSALIAASFGNGLPEHRVEALFNTYIFEKLGYLSEYDKAKGFLTRLAAGNGFDLEPYFDVWLSDGPFMSTVYHPSVRVLSTLARDAAVKAGLVAPDTPVPLIKYDMLKSLEHWPVYPQIAKRLSLAGDFLFSIRPAIATPDRKFMSLREFIADCYALYATFPKALLNQSPIRRARAVLAAEVI